MPLYGWAGTILDVNLTSGKIFKRPMDADFARKWVGGEGFGAKILWDEVGPEVEDGLDPRNVLIYATGPLNATMAPSSGRFEIVTKSPLTGIFGDSNVGGYFAPEMKHAGYDVFVIRGRSEKPVWLWIDDDKVEIRNAAPLWGKTVSETDAAIKSLVGDENVQVSCIGPAGENLVRFSILVNNLVRAPGWTGCGAVAGSKNLKAVAVRGTKGIRIARPDEFEQACMDARKKVRLTKLFDTRRKIGTMYLFRMFYAGGYSVLNNYNITQCPESHFNEICGEKWASDYVVRQTSCYACEMQCGHWARVKDGPYAGLSGDGFEYGTFGAYLQWYGSSNIAFAMAAVKYCNDNGMDGTEPGILLAWATDCYKRGIINKEDTDGLELDWGSEKVALEILKKINHREGFGNLLAEGLARAAKNLGKGSEYYAQTHKGRPCFESNVRISYGCAAASMTSTRGGDHLKGWPYWELASPPDEASLKRWGHPKTGDGRTGEGKAPMTVYGQSVFTLLDLMGTCKFHTRLGLDGLNEEDYTRLASLATGIDFTLPEMLSVAERVYNLEQAFNNRLGVNRKDDALPPMYYDIPIDSGPYKGQTVMQKDQVEKMLDEYYTLRGWDVKTGVPLRKTLERLDMKDVADDLDKRKILPG
ncbi:MAG: aldehyde ferredoxin oxidoreductase family protein [Dehalococcoidia bacterium]|nr:aldehyde ferredoxin oxidoreductase family protein [Dehalococcoidia bacterium]